MQPDRALLLTGGGARGAYQVGALWGPVEILEEQLHLATLPFEVFAGSSSGALNLSFLLSYYSREGLKKTVQLMQQRWLELSSDQIYLTDWPSLAANSIRWISNLGFAGQRFKQTLPLSLLNPTPLYQVLKQNLDIDQINKLFEDRIFHSLAINCFCHNTERTLTFITSGFSDEIHTWKRFKRDQILTSLKLEHIMASSAIPLLFPPVKVGNMYLADGNVRDYAPFSVPVHLGAKKVVMIAVKEQIEEIYPNEHPPTTGKVISSLINAIMSDSIDIDRERIETINKLVGEYELTGKTSTFRKIDFAIIRPTESITQIAAKHHHTLPWSVRYMLKGIGPWNETAELVSYILFERPYLMELMQLGRIDTLKQKDNLVNLLSAT